MRQHIAGKLPVAAALLSHPLQCAAFAFSPASNLHHTGIDHDQLSHKAADALQHCTLGAEPLRRLPSLGGGGQCLAAELHIAPQRWL